MVNNNTRSVGLSGVNYVSTLVNNNGDIFQKIDGDNDIGFDGYIEFIDKDRSFNFTITCQIKTGISYFRNKSIYVQTDKSHIEYWDKHNLYSFLIVYDNVADKCYWLDLSLYLSQASSDSKCIIQANAENELNNSTYQDFKNYVIQISHQSLSRNKLVVTLDTLLSEKSNYAIDDETMIVLHNNRNHILVWISLLNVLLVNDNPITNFSILHFMRLASLNPDIYWHKHNMLNEEIRDQLRTTLNSPIRKPFIRKLLSISTHEEVLFERGSFGQTIYHLLEMIEVYNEILIELISDSYEDPEIRVHSFYLLMFYKSDSYVREHIFLWDMLHKSGCTDSNQYFMVKKQLLEFGGISF